MSEFDCKRFIDIVNKTSVIKETPKDYRKIYDGLSYVVSSCESNKLSIANHELDKNDENFIFKMFEKSKHQRTSYPSNRIVKEKYCMTAMLHKKYHIFQTTVEFKD